MSDRLADDWLTRVNQARNDRDWEALNALVLEGQPPSDPAAQDCGGLHGPECVCKAPKYGTAHDSNCPRRGVEAAWLQGFQHAQAAHHPAPSDPAAPLLLPDGWALTIIYHPAPENRWIASAWNFHGGVSAGSVDGFGRTEAEAIDALRAAIAAAYRAEPR